jgi:tetratricopeptide (TPR) repeat protein
MSAAPRGSSSPLRRALVVGVIAVGAVAIAVGGYQLGGTPASAGASTPSQAPQASAVIDQAVIADLMAAVQADPADTLSLMKLGDEFYRAGDYGAAVTWFQKILDVEKTDIRARLALGAAYFNLGDMAGAETAWLAVLTQDSTNVEAHYDLGFLYLNRDPADMDGVRREWSEVVRLAPDSDVAKTVKAHLDALSSAAPSAPASTAPSPAASTAPSPAASAAPSTSASSAPSAAPSSSTLP